MSIRQFVILLTLGALVSALAAGAYFTRSWWLPRETAKASESKPQATPQDRVILTERAQQNLGLIALPIQPTSFERTLSVPGTIVDQPGRSDRSVVTLVEGVVSAIHHLPGETVNPGDRLFTVTVSSTSLNKTQSELLNAAQDIKLTEAERKRVMSVATEGRLIELGNQIIRLQAAVKSARHELLVRGVARSDLERIERGDFVEEIQIVAPKRSGEGTSASFEIQELRVELGEPVQAGDTLCLLADHRRLAIEGRAFRDEKSRIERAFQNSLALEVDFGEERETDRDAFSFIGCLIGQSNAIAGGAWNASALFKVGEAIAILPPQQRFVIAQMANTMDAQTRTFAFLIPLNNQSRTIERDGKPHFLWRYRPGQRVSLHVPIQRLNEIFVLPAEAVTRDGAEAFVFTQNANTYIRTPVRILLEERQKVVIANDGSLIEGMYVAQSAAAQLNRMVKSQANTVPAEYHVHADGSLHKNEDEGK